MGQNSIWMELYNPLESCGLLPDDKYTPDIFRLHTGHSRRVRTAFRPALDPPLTPERPRQPAYSTERTASLPHKNKRMPFNTYKRAFIFSWMSCILETRTGGVCWGYLTGLLKKITRLFWLESYHFSREKMKVLIERETLETSEFWESVFCVLSEWLKGFQVHRRIWI